MIPAKTAHQYDYSKFIYYHPDTKGVSGRAVYIDPQLIVRFMEVIESQGAKGVEVARGIINLKSTAAGITSDSNKNNAAQHRQHVQNVVVTYTVLQNGGRGAGVYITDLQHGFSSDQGRPGLYKVKQDSKVGQPWAAVEDQGAVMSSSVGFLGALPPSENGDGSVNKTAQSFALIAEKMRDRNIVNGFSLFYTPTYVVDNMGAWLTSDQKVSGTSINCPSVFARLLANTENKSKGEERHRWYIVGAGAKVFQQALKEYKQISKQPLSRSHDFYFVDPHVPLGLLHQDLRDNGIDLSRSRGVLEDSMTTAGRTVQFFDSTQAYANLHRAWERDQAVSIGMAKAKDVFKDKSVCFSTIVKNLSAALQGRW